MLIGRLLYEAICSRSGRAPVARQKLLDVLWRNRVQVLDPFFRTPLARASMGCARSPACRPGYCRHRRLQACTMANSSQCFLSLKQGTFQQRLPIRNQRTSHRNSRLDQATSRSPPLILTRNLALNVRIQGIESTLPWESGTTMASR